MGMKEPQTEMEARCLYCYEPLQEGFVDYHRLCCQAFFATDEPPKLEASLDELKVLAANSVLRSIAVTGVQPKLSLTLNSDSDDPKKRRLTIVGLWGEYILKPPTEDYTSLPENEDLTMHLARLFGLETAEHSLIRLSSGELAYITRRFDRQKNEKIPLEDFCQITETQTADKYRSSLEKVARFLRQFSSQAGLDALSLFRLTLFCFLSGNADMHLKNFSMIRDRKNESGLFVDRLSPAYDLLNTSVAMPEDREETALTLNGKKRKLTRNDFVQFGRTIKLPDVSVRRTLETFETFKSKADALIARSFLPPDLQQDYLTIFNERWARIFG